MVGLDIGSDSIKVAEAKMTKDGITITGLGIARTPQGVIENEVIVDPKALGTAIKALMNESGIKTRKCVSSVSGASQVVVRVISVPKMKREELAETMKWEVERHVPFSPKEIVMDFQPLDKPGDDPNATEMEVLLAVAQQQLIDSHVEALFAAGLKPMAIDIEPLAACRSLIDISENAAASETVAIVNIGSSRTELGVFEDGILTFPSPPIGIAGINFTREIAEALGQTVEQAEVTKREFAAVNLDAMAAPPADAEPTDVQTGPKIPDATVFDAAVGPDDTGDSIFSPGGGIGSSFDLDEPKLAAEPASPSDFVNTADGPVFDTSDSVGGPAFDLGGGDEPEPAPAGPTFDLGGGDEPEPASAGPTFDLGDDESVSAASAADLAGDGDASAAPSAPTFDLGEDEPEQESDQVSEPSFDLSDAGEEADHGKQADPSKAAVQTPAAKVIGFEDGSTEAQVFQAISGVLVDLANELRTSIDYYVNRYGKSPECVYLCGGTAKIPNLDVFLSQELGMPVAVADPIKNLPVKVSGASEQYLNEVSPLLSVCMGLAIRDMIG